MERCCLEPLEPLKNQNQNHRGTGQSYCTTFQPTRQYPKPANQPGSLPLQPRHPSRVNKHSQVNPPPIHHQPETSSTLDQPLPPPNTGPNSQKRHPSLLPIHTFSTSLPDFTTQPSPPIKPISPTPLQPNPLLQPAQHTQRKACPVTPLRQTNNPPTHSHIV